MGIWPRRAWWDGLLAVSAIALLRRTGARVDGNEFAVHCTTGPLVRLHGDAAFPEGSGRTFLDTSETRAHALSISERMPLNDKIGPLAERPVRPKVNRSTGKLAFSQSCRGVR